MPNGEIVYCGRKDDQVKVNGYRIELGSIEATMLQYDEVKKSAVIIQHHADDLSRLVAFVVPDAGFDKMAFQKYLTLNLPDYMIPKIIVELEEMPLNTNGKVDKQQLQDKEIFTTDVEDFVAPRNETEQVLADIWRTVLKIEQVGVFDNFFEKGGHSLLAIKMASLIEQKLDARIPIKVLFQFTCIADLSDYLLVTQQKLDDHQSNFEVLEL